MEVRYNLTLEDFMAFQRYALSSRGKGGARTRWATSNIGWIFWCIVGIFLVLCLVITGHMNYFVLIGFVAPLLICGPLFYWVRRSEKKFVQRKAFEEARRKDLVDDIVVSINPDYFCASNRVAAQTINWSLIEGIAETEEHLFIMTGKAVGYIIPRRAFASDNDFWTFSETARRYQQG